MDTLGALMHSSAPSRPGWVFPWFPMQPTSTFEATVVAELPQQLYRLDSSVGPLVAGLSEESKRLGMKYRTGQRVLVRRASLDPGRGVILAESPPAGR